MDQSLKIVLEIAFGFILRLSSPCLPVTGLSSSMRAALAGGAFLCSQPCFRFVGRQCPEQVLLPRRQAVNLRRGEGLVLPEQIEHQLQVPVAAVPQAFFSFWMVSARYPDSFSTSRLRSSISPGSSRAFRVSAGVAPP